MFARVSWIAVIVIVLFCVYTSAQVVSPACLDCICEVRTGCNTTIGCFGTVCGPFAITWRYWSSAGKPTLNNEELNVNSYSHCVNDPYCAARAVENYMSKFGHDCNGDGVVNCEDYGRIHRFGPNGCTTGLYFPQSNLTLKLPYSARQNEVKLIGLRTLRNNSITPQNVKYQIYIPQEEPSVNLTNTNDVILRNLPTNGALDIVIKATEKNFGEAMLEIKVQPIPTGKTINCADFVQDMCFWNTSRYKIYENQPVTMIGMFGSEAYSYVCPEFRVTRYELLNGTNYFHVVDGKLFANASLDRDIIGPPGGPGPHVKIQVRCVVWEEKTGIQYVQTEVLTIDVLDEDDNPPTIQGQTSINITLKDFFKDSRLVDENLLLLKDADMVTSNQYNIRLLDDTFNALNVTYDILPIDHPQLLNQVPSTAIVPMIYAKKTLLPKSPYCVVLQVTDESLLAGYGVNSVNINITLSGPVHQALTTATPLL